MAVNNICLIGMAGVGKSYLGRKLAARLGWRFVDIDELMERREGAPLQSIVDQRGEAAFKALEERTILGLKNPRHHVIAPGGSAVYSRAAMTHLRALCRVVYLRDRPENIAARIDNLPTRAVIGLGAGTVEQLWRQRRPLYEAAAHEVVDLDRLDGEARVLDTLENIVKK